MDVRQEDQVKDLVETHREGDGRLDVMVNNAGASFRAKVEDISANGWNTVVRDQPQRRLLRLQVGGDAR